MLVVCGTLIDFLDNLMAVEPGDVFEQTVRQTKGRRPVDGDKRTAIKFTVHVQLGAVIRKDEGEYLLEYGEETGTDYQDASQDFGGSEKADAVIAEVRNFCKTRGLELRPGLIVA